MNKKIVWIFSALIILIIGTGLGMLFAQKSNSSFPGIPTNDSVKYSVDHNSVITELVDGLDFVNTESDYKFFASLDKNKKSVLGFAGRDNLFFIPGILYDKIINENIDELSTIFTQLDNRNKTIFSGVETKNDSPSKGDCHTINKIYTYNFDSRELKEIYRDEKDVSNDDGCLAYNIIGMSGSKLILKVLYGSIGNCQYTWNSDPKNYFYLELSRPSEGLKSYTPPEYLVRSDKEKAEVCLKNLQK